MATIDEISVAVGGIYEAGIDPGAWPVALRQVARLLEASAVTVAYQSGASNFPLHFTLGYDPKFQALYAEYYHRLDPVRRAVLAANVGAVRALGQCQSRTDLVRSEFYADWAKPHDFYDSIQVFVSRDGESGVFVAATRSARTGEFDASDSDIVTLLYPHFERSMRVSFALMASTESRVTSASALDRVAHAIFCTDKDAAILFANRRAEELLASHDGLGTDARCLRLSAAAQTKTLRELIVKASAPETPVAERGGAMVAHRPSSRLPWTVMVMPLSIRQEFLLGARPTAMVVVSDPGHRYEASAGLLQAMFGLTPAEATIAADVATGKGLGAVARSRGISLATVKTHLQRTFEKTGTERQAELTRLLASISGIL